MSLCGGAKPSCGAKCAWLEDAMSLCGGAKPSCGAKCAWLYCGSGYEDSVGCVDDGHNFMSLCTKSCAWRYSDPGCEARSAGVLTAMRSQSCEHCPCRNCGLKFPSCPAGLHCCCICACACACACACVVHVDCLSGSLRHRSCASVFIVSHESCASAFIRARAAAQCPFPALLFPFPALLFPFPALSYGKSDAGILATSRVVAQQV